MAWVAEENFDSYSTGDLDTKNGGSGWSAAWVATSGTMTVSTGEFLNSPNSVLTSNAGGGYYTRVLTSTFSTGVLYFAAYMAAGAAGFVFNLRDGGLSTMGITLTAGGDIQILRRTPSISWLTVGTYSDDTMYIFEMDIDITSDQYRIRWKEEGGSYGSYTSYVTPRTTNAIDRVTLNANSGATAKYFDALSASDPDSGPTTSIKSLNGLSIASVKSRNGLAIASIKSINGLSNV